MGTKEELLTMLESRKGEYLSGAELAQALDVSRTAVWKAVNALRSAGYQIQAAQNRGYCLDADTDVLSLRGIQRNLEAHAAGCTLELVPCTASTNALVRERAAAGAPEGLVILANQQTRGRGRLGREFYSPPDTGLYMSLLLRPQEMEAAQAVQITTMAAVAACQAVETLTGKTAQIKWVNDILLGGQKVCGILTEGSFNLETGKPEEVVVGIGFNVYPVDSRRISGKQRTPFSTFRRTRERTGWPPLFLIASLRFITTRPIPILPPGTGTGAWSSAIPSG